MHACMYEHCAIHITQFLLIEILHVRTSVHTYMYVDVSACVCALCNAYYSISTNRNITTHIEYNFFV